MLQTTFGASCMNRASVFEWYNRFKEGREPVRDHERCGRSKEVSREMVELINSDTTVLDALVTCNESWIYCYDPETEYPVEACWLSYTQEGQKEQIRPQNFDDPLFLTTLA